MLRCIKRSETNPYYNLAAEEYLMKTAMTDTFMIWRNKPSVIIGKHQNASKEINHSFIESHKLPVIRRITGGGTVYQDFGNINFSFIFTDRKENIIDFRHFTKPIILFLNELGLNATFEGKNNITVDGLKVSGNSAHIYKNKVLYHGTLLFNTDLDALDQAVAGREDRYKDKSVKSVHAKVTNVSDLLKEKISIEAFINLFQSYIFNYYTGSFGDVIKSDEREYIAILIAEKYKKYEWNFGYSPEYKYDAEWTMLNGKCAISLLVKEGLILQSEITGPKSNTLFLSTIANQITGVLHEKKSISERLKKLNFVNEDEEQILDQIIQHLF